VAGNRLVLLLLTFLACRLFGSRSGTMTRRGLCWKADVTVREVENIPTLQWCRLSTQFTRGQGAGLGTCCEAARMSLPGGSERPIKACIVRSL
jgi:hypothetical protein